VVTTGAGGWTTLVYVKVVVKYVGCPMFSMKVLVREVVHVEMKLLAQSV
jgi:hypothetical protein